MYTGTCETYPYLEPGADGNKGWACYSGDLTDCDSDTSNSNLPTSQPVESQAQVEEK